MSIQVEGLFRHRTWQVELRLGFLAGRSRSRRSDRQPSTWPLSCRHRPSSACGLVCRHSEQHCLRDASEGHLLKLRQAVPEKNLSAQAVLLLEDRFNVLVRAIGLEVVEGLAAMRDVHLMDEHNRFLVADGAVHFTEAIRRAEVAAGHKEQHDHGLLDVPFEVGDVIEVVDVEKDAGMREQVDKPPLYESRLVLAALPPAKRGKGGHVEDDEATWVTSEWGRAAYVCETKRW